MPDSLEEQQFTNWLRRPTLFVANAWYLLAGAGSTILAYLAVFILQIVTAFAPEAAGFDLTNTVSTLYEVLILALPVIWYAARHEGVSQAMRLNPPAPLMMIGSLFAALFGVLFCNCLSTWWMLLVEALGGRLFGSNVPIPQTREQLIWAIFQIGVIPGVCEEIFFRGGLMGAWERRGTWKALFITSVLFALLHGSVYGLPTQLLMGFVLGYIVILSDSLYAGMAFHTAFNSITMILAYLGGSSTEESIEIYQDLAGYINLTGGPIVLLIQTTMLGALFAGCLGMMTLSRKAKGAEIEKIKEGDKTKMAWPELLVLIAGLMTVGVSYLYDFLRVCRVIW